MLLGRERELARIDELLSRARSGGGAVALVEGPAGVGKSALLAEAVRRSDHAGFQILRASGARLERDYAYGVVRQLFRPVVGSRRAAGDLFEGSAQLAAVPLGLEAGVVAAGDASAAMHGLLWLTTNVAERAPLMLAVDDAHWVDAMSLQFVLYLARRAQDLPVMLLVGSRPFAEQAGDELLSQLDAMRDVVRLRPAALTEPEVARLIRQDRLGEADEEFVVACFHASGGNPFLVEELITALIADGASGRAADAARVAGFAPEGVVRWVLARLSTLGKDAERLAGACAVLGAGAALDDAAALAGLEGRAAAGAADALVGAHILEAGRGYAFAHPLLQAAVYDGLGPAWRAEAHGLAARLCADRGMARARVAAHLLASEPGRDGWAVEQLRGAASEASAGGASGSAVRYLERALAETQPPAVRAELLLDLGQAQLQAGVAGATDHIRAALELESDSQRQGQILLKLGRGLFSTGDYAGARDALRRGLAQLPEGEDDLSLELRGWSIRHAAHDADRPALTGGRLVGLLDGAAPARTRTERLVLVDLAYEGARSGARTHDQVARLARRALAEGALLRDSGTDLAGPLGGACYALLCAGDAGEAIAQLGRGIAVSQERGSRIAFGRLSRLRAIAHYLSGALLPALADLESARETYSEGYDHGLPGTMAFLALCLIERDDPAGAAASLVLPGDPGRWRAQPSFAPYLYARGRLEVIEGRLQEGLDSLTECERFVRETHSPNPAVNPPWRSDAALLAAGLGDMDRATALVDEELRLARAFGAPHALGVALRTAGLIEGGERGRERLAEACALLEGSGINLELARALTEHGAALRRAGLTREAREPLRRGLDLASSCGAVATARRAREELIAAGAKPRRERIRGVEALTASELRVAQMAAEGLTNRQIAQSLFISIRTVSVHLGRVYSKLDVSDRAQLGAVLPAQPAASNPDESHAAARTEAILQDVGAGTRHY